MRAFHKDQALQMRLERRGITATTAQARTLRRASMTLTRWAELECGDGNEYGSWAIEREENGEGAPFLVHHHDQHGKGKDYTTRRRIPDRERGALARVAIICQALGAHFYHQADPRGVVLYVSREKLTDQNYSTGGVAIE